MTGPLILGGSDAGISAALFHGMSLDDLSDLDLSYMPPRSLLLDPVLMSVQSCIQEAMACARG
jgi:hypothetical protein